MQKKKKSVSNINKWLPLKAALKLWLGTHLGLNNHFTGVTYQFVILADTPLQIILVHTLHHFINPRIYSVFKQKKIWFHFL